MKITKTKIEGLLIFEPQIFEDDRGSFFESWNKNVFKKYLKSYNLKNIGLNKKKLLNAIIDEKLKLNNSVILSNCKIKNTFLKYI